MDKSIFQYKQKNNSLREIYKICSNWIANGADPGQSARSCRMVLAGRMGRFCNLRRAD
jgi:hypothetical protein